MKAHEILTEYEWQFTSGGSSGLDGFTGGALAAGAAGAKALASRAKNAIKGKPGAVGGAKVGPTKPATPAKPDASRFAKYKELQKAKVAAIEHKWTASVGRGWTMVFRAMSLVVPIAQLLADLEKTKEARDSGELTPEEYEEARKFHVGVFQTQLLIPAIGRFVVNVAKVGLALRLFKNLGALVSAPATAGLSIAAAIASDAAIIWAQQWLGSDDGKEWLSKYLMDVIVSWGSVGTNLYDEIVKKYNELKKR